tara:strand:+ start:625 stop:1116 length:492 start_codon:yes stop_codon:yes gene_type:complete
MQKWADSCLQGSRLDESVVQPPVASDTVPEADHLGVGSSSACSVEAEVADSAAEAPATDTVAIEFDDTAAADVGISQHDQVLAEASSINSSLKPTEESLTIATSAAVGALKYFANEVLYMNINGHDHSYINQDILDAQSHGITLEQWIIWKFENGVDRAALFG